MDRIAPERRSALMARIRSKDTAPEMAVRRVAHRLGYRFRLHCSNLPGRPDIVFPRKRKIVLVHGCFWHQHAGCRRARAPRSRLDYWGPKLARNTERDRRVALELQALGWRVYVIWECETADTEALGGKLHDFLLDTTKI